MMAEMRETLPAAPCIYEGVTISLGAPLRRYSLRARYAATLEAEIGANLPKKIGQVLGDIACLGPDEWLWRSEKEPKSFGAGKELSITDISERSVMIVLSGPGARAALNAGCPLDLELFPVGKCCRTGFDGTEIILHRVSEESWTVDVWRSFAEWLWLALNTAAEHP